MRALMVDVRSRVSRIAAAALRQLSGVRGRDPIVWLIICGCLLVAGIVLGTIIMVGEFRERAIANSERELQNAVLLLTRHFDQQFEDTEIIAADVIAQMNISEISSPDAFREKMSGPTAHRMLAAKVSRLSYMGEVTIFDANGDLINSSGDAPLPEANVSQRAYFREFKTNPDSPSILTEPVLSIFTGTWTTVIAHRLTGANGVFLGVMARRIDPASYEKFFATVLLGPGAAIALLHGDGTMLARYPHIDAKIGKKFNSAPLFKRVLEHGGLQMLRMTSPIDHKDKLGAAAMLDRFPMVVVATNSVDAALADWQEQTRFLILAAALSASVIAFILYLIVRQINRLNRDARAELAAEKQRLDTALNNMTQGLVLYDSSARIVTFNQRYIDMYSLSRDVVKPGLHYYDLIQHRKDTGSYDGDVRGFCDSIMRNIAEGKVNSTIMETPDGGAYFIVNKPLATGGWVATIEDITTQRRLEQERDRDRAFLREIIDHIPTQITVKDARDSRYVLVNSVAEEQFGAVGRDIVGKTPYDIFPQHLAARVLADDALALQSDSTIFIDDHRWETKLHGSRIVNSKRLAIRDKAGEPRYILNVVEDVTERREAEEKIAHLAHYDALTDLPNRVLFRERIERELKKVANGEPFALLYIDIDEFKGINDSLGHHVGDELLKAVASRIRSRVKDSDLVARLGGDEFAVIRTGATSADEVAAFVTRIHEAIRQPYQCLGHQLSSDASIGIAMAPLDGTSHDQLIKNADLAMYAAKSSGRRTHRFFEPAMDASAKARLTMEQDLRQAMADGAFEVHYQPLVHLGRNAVSGCEALLRWRHPERGMISPAEFVPVAEDTGLINELGDWVLRTACAEAVTWPDHVRLAVNVSPVQLKNQTLALRIAGALAASGLEPGRLEIEITEAVLIRDDEEALAILHQLRNLGVRIALDDFGTGFSSLSYLKRFPFDKIKIDRCFVSDISEVDASSSIVEAVVNIAAALNMTTTAEGVETEAQRELLRKLGCTEMQGYLFSAPRPGADVRRLLAMAGDRVAVA
ncbi:MAG TPA: EAL domain-containing protein [Bradyrhizobium sp.]|uniref:bifunctional diguanylate cyclase/phosphodiesterase n=1 Tax=Bradyrhizobium sp. TaxID=376 RepID=UPI002C42752E|nr:EAL domain-containing protein [Bradyrhizobium sp.]HLZ04769.1 EAL domain-containing protein [Bradyrhizobium sp.]